MRWFILLLAGSQLIGCGCHDTSVAPNKSAPVPYADSPNRASRPQDAPPGPGVPDVQVPDLERRSTEPHEAQPVGPRFAPNDRYGWPDDFLLPLVIEFEPNEVPDAIRGPSPPIELGQQ